MPETTESNNKKKATTLHTCACGETHEQHEEGKSHREECESPLKFGKTCCCGSDTTDKHARTPCGHGPRCH